jgi:hypothetical protein
MIKRTPVSDEPVACTEATKDTTGGMESTLITITLPAAFYAVTPRGLIAVRKLWSNAQYDHCHHLLYSSESASLRLL